MDYKQMYYELVEDLVGLLGQVLGECVFDDDTLELAVEDAYDRLLEEVDNGE